MDATKINYCTAQMLDGTQVHVELTTAQCLLASDSWQDDRVLAFEDRGGEIIMHDVRLGDLCELAPEILGP
jgi:hypothetical protein